MSTLQDHFGGDTNPRDARLKEQRLTAEQAMLSAFTDQVEDVTLHYVADPGWGYLVCPGTRCPLCRVGNKPTHQLLLPVLDALEKTVVVLRITDNRGPDSLGIKLLPFLRDESVSEKLLLVSRDRDNHYHVESRPLPENYDCGNEALQRFLVNQQAGQKLASAFPCPTPEQIAEIPSVRQRLVLMGGLGLGTGAAASEG